MFRLAFFVEDKNLAKVLVAVQGLALNMEVPQPVVNATVVKGKIVQAGPHLNQWEQVWDVLRPRVEGGSKIHSTQVRKILEDLNISKNNLTSIITQLAEGKLLKRTAERGVYQIL